jgi:Ca-activated chloride channel family protein
VIAALYLVLQRRRAQYALRFTNIALLDRVAPSRFP